MRSSGAAAGQAAEQGVASATYNCALGLLLRNGRIIIQCVGIADCAINGDVLRILPVDPDLAFRSIQTREEATE